MRKSLLTGILASLSLAVTGVLSLSTPSEASLDNTYYCAQLNGNWNTFVNTPRGRVKLVSWEESFAGNWTPRNRCVEISKRFQGFLDDGSLKYIRTGQVNNLPVLCVAEIKGGDCPSQNVLITLKSDTDPENVLLRLLDFRRSVSGQTIVLSENDAGFYADKEFYVDMGKFLSKVAVDN